MGNRKLVGSLTVTGSIDSFRAFMKSLEDSQPDINLWSSSKGEKLVFFYAKIYGKNSTDETPANMARWEIRIFEQENPRQFDFVQFLA